MMVFLNSNFFQTIILVITVLVTLFIYLNKEHKNLKSATTILILQIKNIEKNIEYLKAEGVSGEAINEQQLHYSIPIFEENAWDKYKHIYASRLSSSDFAKIEQFYEVAQAVRKQQQQIKQKIQENIFAKTIHYYQQQFNRINACVVDTSEDRENLCFRDMDYTLQLYNNPKFNVGTFLHKEYGSGLIKGLNRYQRLTGTTAFERFCKIGKIIDG
ncbi:MAG: hypothetical protein K2I31_04885 [Duncaniella sp.]|nr:hypothetical protein [Duncaniella sp.]